MTRWALKLAFLGALMVQLRWSWAALCGSKQNITFVEIPDAKTLMSIRDFDMFIVDKTMAEMYFALPVPPAFLPDINYYSTISKDTGSSTYLQHTIGESLGTNPTCSRFTTSLKPTMPFSDRALFYRADSSTAQGHWSSCPTKYVWSMRCDKYFPGKKLCDLKDVMLSVYIHGSMDDVPMTDIVEDLCQATGVKFGAANFKWFFSYGKNTLC